MDTLFVPGYNKNQLVGNLAITLENYINSIPVGQDVVYTKLFQVIYDSTPGLLEVSNLTINGVTTDLAVNLNQVARFIPVLKAGQPGSIMTID